jgi:hypothetical protein
MRSKRSCPSCRRKFNTTVALTFHLREEHPSGVSENRGLLQEARRMERAEKKDDAEERARKQVANFCRKYHRDLPCGQRTVQSDEPAVADRRIKLAVVDAIAERVTGQ